MAAAQEYKNMPEDVAFPAIKELPLKEGIKNIPVVIKVAEKLLRLYSADGAQIARQAAMGIGSGRLPLLRPGQPDGWKAPPTRGQLQFPAGAGGDQLAAGGSPQQLSMMLSQGLPTALPKGLSRPPPALLGPSCAF